MQIIHEEYQEKDFWTKKMRQLKVKGAYLEAPLEKRGSLATMASKMKSEEGLVFEIRKVGDILTIWRLK